MHPKLKDYVNRFIPENKQEKFDYFFTQLSLDEYHNKLPYIFNIENFCQRLLKAQLFNEKICVYSDYDTDAVTATATMIQGLELLGFDSKKIDFYAPDRFTEGYGMNPEAIIKLSQDFDLIISVDCGINSVIEAEIVKKSKADLIITDHHHLTGEIPDCLAVVNPRLGLIYNQKPKIFKNPARNFDFNSTLNLRIDQWITKIAKKPKEFQINSQKFLSESVTGVGVAWFCLVWLGYFLAEME